MFLSNFSCPLSLLCEFTILCLLLGPTNLIVISHQGNGLIGFYFLREHVQRMSLETVQNGCLFIRSCIKFGSLSTLHRLTTAEQVRWIKVKELILWQKTTISPTGCQGRAWTCKTCKTRQVSWCFLTNEVQLKWTVWNAYFGQKLVYVLSSSILFANLFVTFLNTTEKWHN